MEDTGNERYEGRAQQKAGRLWEPGLYLLSGNFHRHNLPAHPSLPAVSSSSMRWYLVVPFYRE